MLLNENAFKVLAEFCSDFSRKIYGGQVAKKLKMNQKTVSNILNTLEKKNIVKYTTEGKNKYYFLNKLNPEVKEIIKIVELGRKNKLFERYSRLKNLFLEFEKKAQGILIIFGSYANFTSNEKSDLDIFILGKIEDTGDLEEKYHIKLNVVKSSKDKFNKSEVFINEVIKNHIILKGVEEFIELTWQ